MQPKPNLSKQAHHSQFALRRHFPNSTAHVRPVIPIGTGCRLGPEENKLTPATATPPCHAAVRSVHIHLAAAQCLPESINARVTHSTVWNRVNKLCGQRKPLFQVVDAQEREGIDQSKGEDGLCGQGWAVA